LASGFVLEEGLTLEDFERVVKSMGETCREAGVHVITGDTKVVENGNLGGCVINMSGIGRRSQALEHNMLVVKKYRSEFSSRWLLDSNLRSGDKIILSGTIGDHGLAVLSSREGYAFSSKIKSDMVPLNKVIQRLLGAVGGVVAMKDPTRGGLSNALNEWSEKSKVGILVAEEKIPIRDDVRSACEMLGIDPLEVGNEGKVIAGVVKEKAEAVLQKLKETPEGKNAQIIGPVIRQLSEIKQLDVKAAARVLTNFVNKWYHVSLRHVMARW
jgi:hydrogenase expression/formation protein HypE